MAKITISNRAQPEWEPAIDAKLQLVLGSVRAPINRLDIEFERFTCRRGGLSTCTCTSVLTAGNGQITLPFNQQPDANLAIEGAIAGARRAITRLSLTRAGNRCQASAQ